MVRHCIKRLWTAAIKFDYGSYEQSFIIPEDLSLTHRIIRKLTINGILLKPKKENVVIPVIGGRQICVYRAKSVMNYDKTSQKGFATKRDREEAFECLKMLRKTIKETKMNYERINAEYKDRGRELMEWKFWKGYLK